MKHKFKYHRVLLAYIGALLASSLAMLLVAHGQELPQFPPEHEPFLSPLEPDDIVPLRDNVKPNDQTIIGEKSDKTRPLVTKIDELNSLFATLKRTADIQQADKISKQIQALWSQSGSATVDLLMIWAENAASKEDYAQAMDFLDNVIALDPAYAEGWMRRASIHIQMNDITLAVLELNKVLQYEPRHFNAMMQLGTILEMTDHKTSAINIYNKALEVYPQMSKVQKRILTLLEKQTDQAI